MPEGRPARAVRVVLDASPLTDGRANAGIGRYLAELTTALAGIDGLDLTVARPAGAPGGESWPRRFLHGQGPLLATEFRTRPAVVHMPANDPSLTFPLRRQVVTLHDVFPWTDPRPERPWPTRAYLALQRRRLRGCGALVVVSESVRRDVEAVVGIAPERVHVIPEGVSPVFTAEATERDAALRQAAGVAAGGYLFWVGSLRYHDHRKGVDVLLEALGELVRSGAGTRLVMAGAPGLESARVAGVAEASALPVALTGRVDDATLAALYRGATAVLVPSLHEGFGLPVLEAMACGATVIAAATGNLPDLAGDAALMVRPGSAAELAAAARSVIDATASLEAQRRAGLARAAGFSWRAAAEATVRVYRQVAGR